MATQEISNTKPYISIYNDVISNINEKTSEFVLSAKQKAFNNLLTTGFPTHRKGNEDWKYTDVNKILQKEYKLVEKSFNTSNDRYENIISGLPSYNSNNYNRNFWINFFL